MKGCVGKVGQRDVVPAKICFMFTCHMDDRLATNQSVQLYGSRAGGITCQGEVVQVLHTFTNFHCT